jgi:hypothetical protein
MAKKEVSSKLTNIMKKRGALPKNEMVVQPHFEPWKQHINPVDMTPKKEVHIYDEDTITNSVDELIPMALDVHYKIMKHTRLNPDDDDYVANAKLALSTAQSVLNTQIKVDENQLKKRKRDDIISVLQELKDEERRQAVLELVLEE